jgi:hypothetical protein
MERRELLKHGVTGIAGLGAGYALVEQTTETAQAGVSMGSLSISDASKTTDDGQINDVVADVNGQWDYDIPGGNSPNDWMVSVSVTDGDTVDEIGTESGEAKYLDGSGEWSVAASLTDSSVYDVSDFEIPESGKVKKVTVGFIVVFSVAGDEKVLARTQLEDTATVSVTNKAYDASKHGEAGGSGDLTIQT